MTFFSGVDAVGGVDELRITGFFGSDCLLEIWADVDDLPAASAAGDKPFAIGVEHGVVAIRIVRRLVGMVERRGDENDFAALTLDGGFQFPDAVLVGLEAGVFERQVDAVVHAVAGEDESGLEGVEDAIKPLVETGAGEFPAGVTRLGQAGGGFAAEAEVHDFRMGKLRGRPQCSLDLRRPAAVEGDAVAENRDPQRGGLRGQEKDQTREETD